jgi:hypothetical protein
MGFHYVTFGQTHVHSINGKTFDKDCVARIKSKNYKEGREKAFKYFNGIFCSSYQDEQWDENNMSYFPKGYIDLP